MHPLKAQGPSKYIVFRANPDIFRRILTKLLLARGIDKTFRGCGRFCFPTSPLPLSLRFLLQYSIDKH
jgi:hypothetical protein